LKTPATSLRALPLPPPEHPVQITEGIAKEMHRIQTRLDFKLLTGRTIQFLHFLFLIAEGLVPKFPDMYWYKPADFRKSILSCGEENAKSMPLEKRYKDF
jgi:hypothetical protein